MVQEKNISTQQIKKIIAVHVIPIWAVRSDGRKPLIVCNGSAFLLNIGRKTFLVTARHVYKEYIDTRAIYADTICFLGTMRFTLEDKLICEDKAYDIATFKINEEEIVELKKYGKIPIIESESEWPLKQSEIKKYALVMGFPGDGRKMLPYRGNSIVQTEWHGVIIWGTVTAKNDTSITMIPQQEILNWTLGGCSGGPMLTLIKLKGGIPTWRLTGIIYESSPGIIKASRVDCLNPNGMINGHPNLMAYNDSIKMD